MKNHATHPRIVREMRNKATVLDRAERQASKRVRLTDAQRLDRQTSGGELQDLITELAGILGWEWVHFRPAQTQHGWRTPVQGPLGKGWPDLVLVHEKRRRLIFAELKRELGDELSPEQVHVRDVLLALVTPFDYPAPGLAVPSIEYFTWRPSDLTDGRIQAVLEGRSMAPEPHRETVA